ncbi:MAG: DUF1707 domain-containing protein [Propionibacteriaceae bacterium]|nr:DUF1707 domain-containing protein [Propionibacteriaceae bacterium]
MNTEPTDVGPAVGGDLAIQEADRSHVVTLLTAATNEGLLPADERDRRIEVAQRAATFDDLVPLTRDLVSPQQQPTWNTLPATELTPAPAPSGGKSTEQMIAVFSGVNRKGKWRVKPTTSVFICFGGVNLDFTQAIFEAQEIHINVFCLFGGLDIKIPRGIEVRDSVFSIFGGTDATKLEPGYPNAPVVYLHGLNIFGGTNVKHPKN